MINKLDRTYLKKKEKRNIKDKLSKVLISQSREKEQEYKEGLGRISHFEIRNRMFNSRSLELDQLVKLSKRYIFLIKRNIQKVFYTKKEIKCK